MAHPGGHEAGPWNVDPENERASFWMNGLTDLLARGVKDILIASTDNLNGFTDSIKGVFPNTVIQICVVHQVRNSLRYVVWKEKKEFAADMKDINHAATLEAAEMALDKFEEKWNRKYAYAVRSWRNNWEELTQLFDYLEKSDQLVLRHIWGCFILIEARSSSKRSQRGGKTSKLT